MGKPARHHRQGDGDQPGGDRVHPDPGSQRLQHRRVDQKRKPAREQECQAVLHRMLAAGRRPAPLACHAHPCTCDQSMGGPSVPRAGRHSRLGQRHVAHQRVILHAPPLDHGVECCKLGIGVAGVAHDEMARAGLDESPLQLLRVGFALVELREARKARVGRQPQPPCAETSKPERQRRDDCGFGPRRRTRGDRLPTVGGIADQRSGDRSSGATPQSTAVRECRAARACARAHRCGQGETQDPSRTRPAGARSRR